jgi:hypothetical protein
MVLINKHHSQLKTYNSYHTCIKQLAKRNRIPETYLVSIDRTTIWRWKKEPIDKYLGTEVTNIEILDQFDTPFMQDPCFSFSLLETPGHKKL